MGTWREGHGCMSDKEILNTVLTSLEECLSFDWMTFKNERPEDAIADIIRYIKEKREQQ
jgi:hypothetical protein